MRRESLEYELEQASRLERLYGVRLAEARTGNDAAYFRSKLDEARAEKDRLLRIQSIHTQGTIMKTTQTPLRDAIICQLREMPNPGTDTTPLPQLSGDPKTESDRLRKSLGNGQAASRLSGNPNGILLTRDLTIAGGSTTGAALVPQGPTVHSPGLPATNDLSFLGVTYLDSAGSSIPFTVNSTLGTAEYVAEGSAPSLTDPAFGSRYVATAHGCMSWFDLSRRLIAIPSVETLLRQMAARAVANEELTKIFHGAGGDEPTGILSWSGVGTNDGTDITRDVVKSMKGDLATSGANLDRAAFLASGAGFNLLSERDGVAGTGIPLMDNQRMMLAHKVHAIPQLSDALILGDWSQLVVVRFGFINIMVNPFVRAHEGMIRVLCESFIDSVVLEAGAFSIATPVS